MVWPVSGNVSCNKESGAWVGAIVWCGVGSEQFNHHGDCVVITAVIATIQICDREASSSYRAWVYCGTTLEIPCKWGSSCSTDNLLTTY